MNRIILILTLLICAATMSARTFVLITAVSNYDNQDLNLTQTTKDAKSFKKVMETQTKDITLLTSKYANKENIMEKLRAICNRAQEGDEIVFFFSGHGLPGGIGTYNGVLTYSQLVDLFDTSKASRKIAYIDACHAGSVQNEKTLGDDVSGATKGKKDQIFFVSSRADEYSIENAWVGAGFFSQALVKGLRGKSDSNGDKQITVLELFKYIYNDVVKRSGSKQHPQLIAPASLQNSVVMKW